MYWRGRESSFGMVGVDEGNALQSVVVTRRRRRDRPERHDVLGLSTGSRGGVPGRHRNLNRAGAHKWRESVQHERKALLIGDVVHRMQPRCYRFVLGAARMSPSPALPYPLAGELLLPMHVPLVRERPAVLVAELPGVVRQ